MSNRVNVRDIGTGDWVVLRDQSGNVIAGDARFDGTRWFVAAFATQIVFATSSNLPGGKRRRMGVDVVSFNPPLPLDDHD